MAQSIADFFSRHASESAPGFRAEPWYNRYGDTIHYHWREDEFYAYRVDDKLTVYRSISGNEAVGCEIKGVTALRQKLGGFGVELNEHDGTPLALFLFISAVDGEPSTDLVARQQTYQYLLEQVGKQRVGLEEVAA